MNHPCAQCGGDLDEDFWFTLIVTEEDGITTGHICSLNCLTDYVAEVHAELLEEFGDDD